MTAPAIRTAIPADLERIKAIAVASEMFTVEEVGFFDEILAGFFDRSMQGHQWLVAEDHSGIVAAAHYAPEPFSDRMWNLYFIAVDPGTQGKGIGALIESHVEDTLRSLGEAEARVLIVETSSTQQYARTRDFYAKIGFDEEAQIRQFYGPGDDKIVFWKSLVANAPGLTHQG